MDDFFNNLDFQQLGSSVLELVTFLVVVIVIIAILDRWGPGKPTTPPKNGSDEPAIDVNLHLRSEMDKDDTSPIPLEGEDDSDFEKDKKLPPASM